MNIDNEKSQSLNESFQSNGRLISNEFKYIQTNYTVPLFQTQYLLKYIFPITIFYINKITNSYIKFHSQNRFYYCSVKDCFREIDGKKFKRKNEIIRYKLIYNLSEYICPLYSQQQRRYPQPNNLQK
jgi:hypothetical protein